MKPSFIGLIAAVFALSAVPFSRAQVIFDNIGNGNPFTPTTGYLIGQATNEKAVRFTAGSSAFLDYADLSLFPAFPGSVLTINVELLANTGTDTPGALLETTSSRLPLPGSPVFLTRAEFSNSTFLVAGTFYWLEVAPAAAPTGTAWEFTGRPVGLIASGSGGLGLGDSWSAPTSGPEGGVRIFGVGGAIGAIPEPDAYGLIGSAILVSVVALRRRSNAKG